MAKILVASSCYPPLIRGGAELSTKSLCEALVRAGHQVLSLSFSDRQCEEHIEGVSVVRLVPSKGYALYFSTEQSTLNKLSWRLREEYSKALAEQVVAQAQRFGADVLVTSTIEDVSSYSWKLARKLGIKTITVLRSYYLMCLRGSLFKGGKNCQDRCIECKALNLNKRRLSAQVDAVVGISQFVLDAHLEEGYFKGAKQRVIGNICFDQQLVKPKEKSLYPDTGLVRLGYLGRVHPTKGLEELFQAFAKSSNRDQLLLQIAGDGESDYLSELKQLAENLGIAVNFLGHTAPAQLFENVDVLVVPSVWREPFGRIIVEAAAHDTPVIARAMGGISELVSADIGWLYDDFSSLVDLLDELDGSQLRKFSPKLKSQFQPQQIAQSWGELFDELLAQAPQSGLFKRDLPTGNTL